MNRATHQAADAVKAGKLALVLRKHEPTAAPINLVYVGERRVSGKLRVFLDFAAPRPRERMERTRI